MPSIEVSPPDFGWLRELVADARRRSAAGRDVDLLRRAAWLIFAIGLVGFLILGADRPRNPKLIPSWAIIPSRLMPGFGEVGFQVAGPYVVGPLAGRRWCAALATSGAQQHQGLMGRQDLAGYQGMIFRFDTPVDELFVMKNTLIPLSIAWFDMAGKYLSSATMLPCPKGTNSCATYRAGAPYTVAIEVRAGALLPLGIGPGSTITVGGPC